MTNREKFLAGKKFTVKDDAFTDTFFYEAYPLNSNKDFGFIREVNDWCSASLNGSVKHCMVDGISKRGVTVIEFLLTAKVRATIFFKDLIFLEDDAERAR